MVVLVISKRKGEEQEILEKVEMSWAQKFLKFY